MYPHISLPKIKHFSGEVEIILSDKFTETFENILNTAKIEISQLPL